MQGKNSGLCLSVHCVASKGGKLRVSACDATAAVSDILQRKGILSDNIVQQLVKRHQFFLYWDILWCLVLARLYGGGMH